MSKLYIFGIGGTGERVMRSFTMLLAAGVPTFRNYDIYPIIIDYDADNADKQRTRDILEAYRTINRLSFENHVVSNMSPEDGNKGQFFGSPVKELNGLQNFVLDFDPGNNDLKFRDKLEYDLIHGELLKTKDLIESLYDTSDNPTTELNLDLRVGFKGNPNIGSVIFHQLNQRNEYRSFRANYHANQGDKVVVIGSLFGGTGASGIPVLVQHITNDCPQANIAALMIQPYFEPEIVNNGAINGNLFAAKTKAALNFYNASGIKDKLTALYHIGDPYPTILPYCEGGKGQKNNANPVEFLSALAIEHFVAGNAGNGMGNEYMFGLDRDIVSRRNESGKQEACRIFIQDFDNHSKDSVLKYLDAFTFCMKYVHDFIYPNKLKRETPFIKLLGIFDLKREYSVPKGSNKLQDLLVALDSFYALFKEWLEELDFKGDDNRHIQPNSHRLSFYSLKEDFPQVVEKPQEAEKDKSSTFSSIFGGRPKTKYSSLTESGITSMMNAKLKDRGHLDNKELKTNEKEYVLMDILRADGIDIITNY